ncbi:MAG TPA: outer membrane protein transport protein [Kofleriaceae bacterium]|nr:outer membrane protein transport protein [Kofleriaceae bacterium]
MGLLRHAGVAWITIGVAAATAHASPVEIFGFGPRHGALAGAGVASTDDFAALYYNPAGLALGTGESATIGVQGAFSNLSIDDRVIDLEDPAGVVLGFTAPAPLGGPLENRLRVGVALYLLPTTIARVSARFPQEPFFPWYQGRTERDVIVPGAALRVSDRITVGLAVNFLAGVVGGLEASEGAQRSLVARVDEKVPSVARVHAGIDLELTDRLRAGLVYRQRFEVPFSTLAKTEVAGEPIDLDLHASGQFTPDELAIGGAWHDRVTTISVDAQWSRWSAYPGPFVTVESELPLVGPLAASIPTVPYRDTWAGRAGVETRVGEAILRGGYAFETSPFPKTQTGVTNLLDGPKHTVGLGVGFVFERSRIDVGVQAQFVGSRRTTKTIYTGDGSDYDPFTSLRDEDSNTDGAQISNPGYPSIDSGGQVFSGGVAIEVPL